jgi:internalin A
MRSFSEGLKLRVSVLEATGDQGKRQSLQAPNESSVATSAIGALSVLGWQVQPGEGNRIQFSDIYKHISIRRSAPHFFALDRPFNVNIVGARSLEGVGDLRNAKHLVRFELDGAEIGDLSEIGYLNNIQIFIMSQTVGHISDLGPLKDLTNLRELGVDSAAIRDLSPIQGLTGITTLSIGGTQVSDLSPLRNFRHLSSLNLGGAPVTDLSPLVNLDTLTTMRLTGAEVPALATLVRKERLKSLSIYAGQGAVDLSPVAELSGLEMLDLDFFSGRGFDISPVRHLTSLKILSIGGNGFEYFSFVNGLDAIGALTNLQKLSIFGVQMTDLNFATPLQNLTELSVTNAPLSNISALGQLRSLSNVSLTGTLVVDISPLVNLPELTQLGIVRTPARSDVVTQLEHRGVKIQR